MDTIALKQAKLLEEQRESVPTEGDELAPPKPSRAERIRSILRERS
jgi:hypothetical protein